MKLNLPVVFCAIILPAFGADSSLRGAFERARYALQDFGQGSYRGVNPRQRLSLQFDAAEARVVDVQGSDVSFHLAAYGYGRRLRAPELAKPVASGNRVEYRRRELTEWYVNEPGGLEQGFTLEQRLSGAQEGEPLVIALAVIGRARPELAPGNQEVMLGSGGHPGLRYGGLRAFDARGSSIPSSLEVSDSEIRLIIQDSTAQYPLTVDPLLNWTQQEVTGKDTTGNDNFGESVSLSGDTAVIGAYEKTIGSNVAQGAAYVFVHSSTGWNQQAELTASDGAANDNFGISVAVSADTVVIGAFQNKIGSNSDQGAAYVFVRTGTNWSLQQKLTASDGAPNDFFGASVSLAGDTAVIGASEKKIGSNAAQGAAYVFVRSGTSWSQQAELTASDGAAFNYFGASVSLSGDTAVIGAFEQGAGADFNAGAAYVFVRGGSTWSQQQELTASDRTSGDQFGNSVSVSGDTVVVGAPAKTIGSNAQQGAAYVFVRGGSTWSQQQELTPSDGAANAYFGNSVSVSGGTAVIGAFRSNNQEGASYVFVPSGSGWSQQQEVNGHNGSAGDWFGESVSAGENAAVVGAGHKCVGSTCGGAADLFALPALSFVPIAPCRAVDTRNATGPLGGPRLSGGASRSFAIAGNACSIPASAQALSLNATVVPRTTLGYLTIWPAGQTQPVVSTLNSLDGRIKADAAIVAAGTNGAVNAFVTDDADLILDIDGYFVPATDTSALSFYALTPCRIADTRAAAAPSLSAGQSRTFTISGTCVVPSRAQAYSLNFTVVPKRTLGYLTVWSTGQPKPVVSTLNALTGAITANAAIVPAGSGGDINVYATDGTDLIIDVNGYFAPPGGGGLSLYTLAPCRVLDTRNPPGSPPITSELDVIVFLSPCDAPSNAQAYVFNATVVPPAPLGYLTLWPNGVPKPVVSTLNALDGAVTSNMAIVPTINGSISAFPSNATHLILDIAGYFAP